MKIYWDGDESHCAKAICYLSPPLCCEYLEGKQDALWQSWIRGREMEPGLEQAIFLHLQTILLSQLYLQFVTLPFPRLT